MTVPIVPRDGAGQLGIDPRFRARRDAVRHEIEGRHRLHRLVILVLAAAIALAAVIVLESPILDVDRVAITGVHPGGTVAVADAVDVRIGSALLLADLDAAERRVEALPWVEEATVVRDMPGTVHVDVVERTPAAVMTDGSRTVLVDPAGRIVAEGDPATFPGAAGRPPFVRVEVAADAGLAPLGGTVDDVYLDAVALADRLRGDPAGAVAAVQVAPFLQLLLTDGAVVQLGDGDQLDSKVEAFRAIHARVDGTCVTRIDLRVPERPVLTRDEPCS